MTKKNCGFVSSRTRAFHADTPPCKEHDRLAVPAGTLHNIRNTSKEPLKLHTICARPARADGTVHKTKAGALHSERVHHDQPARVTPLVKEIV